MFKSQHDWIFLQSFNFEQRAHKSTYEGQLKNLFTYIRAYPSLINYNL